MTLDEATKDYESRFKRVITPEPCAYVSVTEPKEDAKPDDVAASKISFVVVGSGLDGAGNYKMFPTEADAIAAWRLNMDAFLAAHAGAETLYWRVKPEIALNKDFARDESGWAVYSRLAAH